LAADRTGAKVRSQCQSHSTRIDYLKPNQVKNLVIQEAKDDFSVLHRE
jgi:hypothetical protein